AIQRTKREEGGRVLPNSYHGDYAVDGDRLTSGGFHKTTPVYQPGRSNPPSMPVDEEHLGHLVNPHPPNPTTLHYRNMAQNMDLKTPLLDAGFTGDLITPSDPDYQTSLRRFAKNAQRNAGLVAFVKSAEDVARAIKFASTNSVSFVVRGGGHSTGGSSSIEGGMVIDLSKYLNSVRVDEENKLGYVGGGANWKAVDEETIKYGLATVG
ncbi:13344_t:CDS:2, partial [Acaulospora colombiana]